jgi:hypothetical protein
MTVSALVTRNDITATASQTSFTYTFRVLEATDMDVYQNGSLLASGYTVNDVGVNTGGTVTLDVGVPVGQIVSLVLAMPLDRTTNYQNSGDFLAGDVNGDFDKIYIGAIQNENEGGRSLRLKDVEPPTAGVDMTIPLKADRLGKFLAFDSVTGGPIAGSGAAFFDSAAWSVYDFTGDGSTVAFTLGSNPATENNTQVYIDGVYQQKDGYSVAGAVLTFSVAPPNLSTIEVMVVAILPIGSTSSDLVSYTPAGTGAVATTVQTKLRETVSVKDFGAVGDGTTDDITAFNLATAYASSTSSTLIVPAGIYGISSSWNLLSNIKVQCAGTIKFLAGASGGHVVGIYNASTSLSNINWEGGTVDANNVAGQNAFGIGGFFGAVTGAKVSNVTCKNAQWDNSIFGGKGFTVQHDCFDIQVSNIRIEDCSIGLSVESTNLKAVNNVNIDNVIVDNCDKFGFYGAYSYVGGIEDPDKLACIVTNITLNNCADSYTDQGVINLDRMNGLIMNDVFIRSSARVAPLRGTATNSSITFHVDAPEIEDIVNLDSSGGIPVGDVNLVPSNLIITATARASTQIYGELITFDATKVPINCRFDIRYETPAGPTVGLFTTGMNNTSTYKIQDVVTGKIIEGSCDNDPIFSSQYYKQFYDTQVIASSLLVQDASSETRLQPLKGELKLKDNSGGTRLITATTGVIVDGTVQINTSGPQIYSGTGVPSVTAIDGSIFMRTDGGANSLYIRESGAWVAK